jgi:hypothetical protein
MVQASEELPKSSWHEALESLSKEHQGDELTIEVLALDFGDQEEAEKLPFAYIEYDEHDDTLNVAVGGRDSRYAAVLRHAIEHPRSVVLGPSVPGESTTLKAVGADDSETLITFFARPALPA